MTTALTVATTRALRSETEVTEDARTIMFLYFLGMQNPAKWHAFLREAWTMEYWEAILEFTNGTECANPDFLEETTREWFAYRYPSPVSSYESWHLYFLTRISAKLARIFHCTSDWYGKRDGGIAEQSEMKDYRNWRFLIACFEAAIFSCSRLARTMSLAQWNYSARRAKEQLFPRDNNGFPPGCPAKFSTSAKIERIRGLKWTLGEWEF